MWALRAGSVTLSYADSVLMLSEVKDVKRCVSKNIVL